MKENKMGAEFLGGADQHLFKKIRGPAKREEVRTGEKIDKPEEIIKVFLDRYAQVLQREDEQKRERGVEAIWRMVKRNHIIKEENISKAFNNHLKIERDRGKDISWGEDITKSEIPRLKKEYAERVIGDQEDSLYNWIEYFASHETDAYPLWFKFLALKNVLRVGEYKVNEKQFYKRTKYTAKPFLTLNKQALAGIYEHFNKIVEGKDIETEDEEFRTYLENKNFVKAYIRRMEILKRNRGAEHLEVIDGKWRRFTKGQEKEMFDSLQGHHTGWCLEGSINTCEGYLDNGDALIYYSNDKRGDPTIPRLTIAFRGKGIREISGIEEGQTLDEYIFPVLKEKLEEYPQEAERYNKAAEDMKRVTEIHNSPLSISKEDLRFLYEIDGKIHNFLGGEEMIEEILRGRDKIEDVAYIFGVPKDQISTSEEEALSGKCVYHLGNLLIEDKELAELKRNGGTKFPIVVEGEYEIDLSITDIKGIPPLPEGVDRLELDGLTNAEGLNIPEGVVHLQLKSLKTAEGLKIPEGVKTLSLNGLTNPEGLKIPESVYWLSLNGLKTAEGLNIPESVRTLYLDGLKTAEGLNIPEGVRVLSLDGLKTAEGLKIPESVCWLSLKDLASAEGLPPLPKYLETLTVSYHMSDEEVNKLRKQYPYPLSIKRY
ncbi:MAG: hypothetical protein OXU73_02960 [Candidatus Campbellbacteria bacterium]|nr:hypothetical protein [Candidatus Campbellbacteria bacterium]